MLSGCLSGEIARCAARATDSTRRARPPNGTRSIFNGPLLPRTAGQQAARPLNEALREIGRTARPAAGRDQRLPLSASRRRARARSPALHPDRQDAWPTSRAGASIPTSFTSRRPRRWPRRSAPTPSRVRNTMEIARPGRLRIRVRQVPFPDLPGRADGSDADRLRGARDDAARSARAWRRASPRCARAAANFDDGALLRAARPRAAGHPRDGLFGLHADRRRLHRLRAQPGHPGRPGPRLGGRQPGLLCAAASPNSIRSSTSCCSSDGSIRGANRCPISTSTSASSGATKCSTTCAQKYGEDRVAQIITFGTIKGKQAIRDVGRVLGLSFAETDRIVKLYPAPKQGRDFPLSDALEMEPRLKEERKTHPELFDYAFKLEGLLRHASRHAAGVVISDVPLDRDGAALRRQGARRRRRWRSRSTR